MHPFVAFAFVALLSATFTVALADVEGAVIGVSEGDTIKACYLQQVRQFVVTPQPDCGLLQS